MDYMAEVKILRILLESLEWDQESKQARRLAAYAEQFEKNKTTEKEGRTS